jgi:hypothetical protein
MILAALSDAHANEGDRSQGYDARLHPEMKRSPHTRYRQ